MKRKIWNYLNRTLIVKALMVALWKLKGKPAPPPHAVKQKMIKTFVSQYKYNVFVETGTYLGAMIRTIQNDFNQVYTVELSPELHARAVETFKQYPYIHCLQGDSGIVLHNLVPEIKEGAIFWLDGHYSGGITALGDKVCPVYEELDAIITHDHFNHIILIDDARLFLNREQGYPTVEEVKEYVNRNQKGYNFYLLHTDTIVITKLKLDGRAGIDRYLQKS
jgi:hypothetical protein